MTPRISRFVRVALLSALALSIAACGTLPRTSPTPPTPVGAPQADVPSD